MSERPAWGIHVTTTSVTAVKIGLVDEKPILLAHEREEFVEAVEDLTRLDKITGQLRALTQFVKRHGFTDARVMVTCDAATAFNRYVEAPMMTGSSLESLLDLEAQQNIPFPLDDVFWDYQILDVRHEDQLAEIMLFAVKKELIEARLRTVHRTGLPCDGVQLAPIALLNFLQFEGVLRAGTAVVWVDYDRTDILVRNGKRFWFRTLPDGVHRLLTNLRDEMGLKHRDAVRILKGELRSTDPERVGALRAEESKRLAGEISRVLRYYSGAQSDFELENVVVIPGTAVCPPLGSAIKAALGTKVHGLNHFRRLQLADDIATPSISEHPGQYGPAIGCALQSRGLAEVAIKLYPKDAKRFIAGRRIYYAISLLLLAFLVMANYWRSGQRASEAETAQIELKAIVEETELRQREYSRGGGEQDLLRELAPYTAASKGRLDVVGVVAGFLSALDKANTGLSADERLHVVRVGGARGEANEKVRVTLVLGRVLRGAGAESEMTRALREGLFQRLKETGFVSDLQIEKPFVAGDLVLSPIVDEGNKLTRRRFVIWKVIFQGDARLAGGSHG